MPDLYVSALGVPFRAAVAQAGGERAFVRLGDRPDDDFGLDPGVWVDHAGAATGAQAASLDRAGHVGTFRRLRLGDAPVPSDGDRWTDRDLLAVVVRRLLAAAEAQSGEPIGRVVCVVPTGLAPQALSDCAQAAVLAGAQQVELVGADRALRPAGPPAGDAHGTDVVVEVWDDGTRLTVSAADGGPARATDVSPELSRTGLRDLFRLRTGLADGTRLGHAAVVDRLFDAWVAGKDVARGIAVTLPAARGAPLAAFVPASVFAALDAALSERFGALFAAHGIDATALRSIAVAGSWTRPAAKALRALVGPGTIVRDDRGLELDGAIRAFPPQARSARPALSADVYAVAESARPLRALAEGEPILLLASGSRLPATSISENFRSSSYIGSFQIAAVSQAGTTPLMALPIPRYAERQASSYLRLVVHADTPELMLLEVAYLYSARRRFAFFDKAAASAVPVSDHVFRFVRG